VTGAFWRNPSGELAVDELTWVGVAGERGCGLAVLLMFPVTRVVG